MEALLLIDIQEDFLPTGALPVSQGDEIIPVVNNLQQYFDLIVATQDWHPEGHISFASTHQGKQPGDVIYTGNMEQRLWPRHCVQGSPGAEFAKNLRKEKITTVIRKGIDPMVDSYSGFYDNQHKRSTGLHDLLLSKQVNTIYLAGLAADVCVLYTALDAVEHGYNTFFIEDAAKAAGGEEGFRNSVNAMINKGIHIINSKKLIEEREKK